MGASLADITLSSCIVEKLGGRTCANVLSSARRNVVDVDPDFMAPEEEAEEEEGEGEGEEEAEVEGITVTSSSTPQTGQSLLNMYPVGHWGWCGLIPIAGLNLDIHRCAHL